MGGLIGGLFVAKQITPIYQFMFVALISIIYLVFAHPYLMPSEKNKQPLNKMWNKPSALMLQFGFIALGNMICEGMMFDWSGLYFQNVALVPNEYRTMGYICFMACMTIGRMFADILINYWVGSSYEWNFNDALPSQGFKEKMITALDAVLKLPYEVVDHLVGIRPANTERRPFVGLHPKYPQLGICNGMGTKGCSLAPYFTHQLIAHIEQGTMIEPEADIKRFTSILSD